MFSFASILCIASLVSAAAATSVIPIDGDEVPGWTTAGTTWQGAVSMGNLAGLLSITPTVTVALPSPTDYIAVRVGLGYMPTESKFDWFGTAGSLYRQDITVDNAYANQKFYVTVSTSVTTNVTFTIGAGVASNPPATPPFALTAGTAMFGNVIGTHYVYYQITPLTATNINATVNLLSGKVQVLLNQDGVATLGNQVTSVEGSTPGHTYSVIGKYAEAGKPYYISVWAPFGNDATFNVKAEFFN